MVPLRAKASIFGVVGSLYPYRDISSALKASNVTSRKLDLGRCGASTALAARAVLPSANSVTTSAAAPATVATAVRRVILSPRKPSRLLTTSLRARGMQSAMAKTRKWATSNSEVNLTPRFDHLIRACNANLESANTTKTTATLVAQSARRSRDDLKYQRKGAKTAVQRVPRATPASATKIRRTTTSKATSGVVR